MKTLSAKAARPREQICKMKKDLMMSNPVPTGLAVLLLSTLCLTAGAAAEQLDGPEIKKLIAGETVRLNTPFGIALPLRYRTDGVVVGDVSGFSAARMFAPKEEGRWWIEANSLCQKWPSWYKGRQFCFKIASLGKGRISWLRDDGASGTARVGD